MRRGHHGVEQSDHRDDESLGDQYVQLDAVRVELLEVPRQVAAFASDVQQAGGGTGEPIEQATRGWLAGGAPTAAPGTRSPRGVGRRLEHGDLARGSSTDEGTARRASGQYEPVVAETSCSPTVPRGQGRPPTSRRSPRGQDHGATRTTSPAGHRRAVWLANQQRAARQEPPLPEAVTPRTFRRTFITLMLEAGRRFPTYRRRWATTTRRRRFTSTRRCFGGAIDVGTARRSTPS